MELMAPAPKPFRECLQVPGAFSIAVELVTARGVVTTERSRALVEKARSLAADPRYAHPAYWAPFLLIGNWL